MTKSRRSGQSQTHEAPERRQLKVSASVPRGRRCREAVFLCKVDIPPRLLRCSHVHDHAPLPVTRTRRGRTTSISTVFGSLSGTSVDVLVPVIATTTAQRCFCASLRELFGDERPVPGVRRSLVGLVGHARQ